MLTGFAPLLTALDLAASVSFAATGALVASRKQLDLIGFMWLAVITGVGGGTLRDLMLGLPVFWVVDPTPVIACLITAVVVHFTAHFMDRRYRYLLWLDAFGLALVAVAGCAKATDAGAGALVAIVMGVVTASAGGIIRDTLGQEPSIIFRREIYVAAAALGAGGYLLALEVGLTRDISALVGFGLALLLRLLALGFNWSMPAYRARAGRVIEPPKGDGPEQP